jgi:hypothetical protein
MRRFLFLCALLLAGHAAGAAAESPPSHGDRSGNVWNIEQVVAALKEGREPAVPFEETTYSSLLSEPLVARGVLRFRPPATLEKEVLKPYRERYVIEGDRVTFESERKHVKKIISLEEYPALRSFVEAFRASITGDAARLKQTYETTLDGDRRTWRLLLRPLDPSGKSLVDHILLSGSEGRIATITIRAPDGDRSVMTLSRGNPP